MLFPKAGKAMPWWSSLLGARADLLYWLQHHLEMFSGKSDLLLKTSSLTCTLAATTVGSVGTVGRM